MEKTNISQSVWLDWKKCFSFYMLLCDCITALYNHQSGQMFVLNFLKVNQKEELPFKLNNLQYIYTYIAIY